MFRFSIILAFNIFHLIPISSISNDTCTTTVQNVTHKQYGEFIEEVVPKKLFDQLKADYMRIETDNLNLANELQSLRPTTVATEKLENSTNAEITTEYPRSNNQSKGPGVYKENRELKKELKKIKQEQNETDNYLFQFKWKVLVKHEIIQHEEIFDKLELLHTEPVFVSNETAINETGECWNYDVLAERRRQRWEFYLKTPPYTELYFNRLLKRIEGSRFTIEKFCLSLAMLYKQLSFSAQLEVVKTIKFTTENLSHFKRFHFVIHILLANYPRTELTERILDEKTDKIFVVELVDIFARNDFADRVLSFNQRCIMNSRIVWFGVFNCIVLTTGQNNSDTNVTSQSSKEFLTHNETKPQNLTETEKLHQRLNETEYRLYQLEWKVILKQYLDNYEAQFAIAELAKLFTPPFQTNETLLHQMQMNCNYDRPAEQRKQRWLFYLDHTTPWTSFQNLVERIKHSNYTEEQFSVGLATLYKRISFDIYNEAMQLPLIKIRPVSDYTYVNWRFVIRLIFEDPDIPKTDPVWNVIQELNRYC